MLERLYYDYVRSIEFKLFLELRRFFVSVNLVIALLSLFILLFLPFPFLILCTLVVRSWSLRVHAHHNNFIILLFRALFYSYWPKFDR